MQDVPPPIFEIETVEADGLSMPEGPIVMPDGSILLVEILGGCLTRVWNGKKEIVAQIGGAPAGAQIGPDGAVYICNLGGYGGAPPAFLEGEEAIGRIERVDLATGKVERLFDHCEERPLSAPDDLVFDRHGNLWFTDMGKDFHDRTFYGGLYCCRPDGSQIYEVHFGSLSFNGIGLSPSDDSLVVSDTKSARLYRFDIGLEDFLARAPSRIAPRCIAAVPGDKQLDSLAVLASGRICVGTLYEGGVAVIAGNGDVTHVALLDRFVTNMAFGGPDMRSVWFTFSESGQLVRARSAEPGLPLHFSGLGNGPRLYATP